MITLVSLKLKKILYIKNKSSENGSDMIVTIVFHLLKDFMKDHGGKLPRKLHLNLGKDQMIIVLMLWM